MRWADIYLASQVFDLDLAVLIIFASHIFFFLTYAERASCFAFIVFWMYCYCICPLALPHGDVGWSVLCVYVISGSYSLTFYAMQHYSIRVKSKLATLEKQKQWFFTHILPDQIKIIQILVMVGQVKDKY